MIETIGDMPPGTLGFRATGIITRADYVEVVLPSLHDALDEHGVLRTLHQLGPGLDEFDPRALWGQVKEANTLGMEHLGRLERTAVSTDEAWVRKSLSRFAWLVPGDFKVFGLGELEAARGWLARY